MQRVNTNSKPSDLKITDLRVATVARAERLLREAEVVVYDRLVGPDILALIRRSTTYVDRILARPTATTALFIKSDGLAVEGTVYDSPPLDYREPTCKIDLTQNGNHLSGDMCGRRTGVDL